MSASVIAHLRTCMLCVALAVGLTGLAGCASKTTIDASSTESIIAGVNKGDAVRIKTRKDAVHTFVITKITNKALYGDNARVVYEDMAEVEVVGEGGEEEEGGFFSRLF
jgi:hypothetical protein